jgi:hypothetical protein
MEVTPNSNFKIDYFFSKPCEEVDEIIQNMDNHINRIAIPKKDGSKRIVLAPSKDLKYTQRCLYWKFFKKYKQHDAAHGFINKRGIVTNATIHVGAKSLGIIDIKSFFDSISENHFKNVLFGNKNICKFCKYYDRMVTGECNPSLYHNKLKDYKYMCNEILAVFSADYYKESGYISLFTRVIKLCTYEGFTAQGFPTSPIVANIVLRGLDKALTEKLQPLGINYTRYADDLCISSKTMIKDELKKAAQSFIYKELWAFGFKPNKKKTTWKQRTGRLKVCGIVVNEKLSIQRRLLKKFRAKVHHITVKRKDTTTRKEYRSAKGYASYIMSVDRSKGKKYYNQLASFGKEKGWEPKDE